MTKAPSLTQQSALARQSPRAGDAPLTFGERELHAVMDSVPAMICYADTGMRLGYANQRYAEWVGWRREALIGKQVREIVGAETFALMEPHLREVLSGREVRYERRERERDCHKVQGYLFGRPMPAEELARQLAQRGRTAA
jgi:PAS domain S-box-containing protein